MRPIQPETLADPGLASKKAPPVLAWILLFKCVYLAAVYLCLRFWGDLDAQKFHDVNQRWPREGEPVFASHFATWDAAHYLFLSEVGYKPGAPSDAFYPMWPLVMRWAAPLFGGSHLVAGMTLANLLSIAGFLLFYRLATRRFGSKIAAWSLVFLIAFPGSLFYQFVYTESLFFLLLMILWRGLEEKRYGLAWIGAFFLPLSRAVGVFSLLPIAWHLLTRAAPCFHHKTAAPPKASGSASVEPGSTGAAATLALPPITSALLPPFALLAAPLLGWGLYFLLMRHWTGDAFWGFKAQRFWGVHSVWNLVNLPKFAGALCSPSNLHDFTGSLFDRLMFVLVLYTLPVFFRRKLGYDLLLWLYVLGILTAMSGEFTSYTRFASTAFPAFIAFAFFFTGKRPVWVRAAFLGGCAGGHLILLWQFVNFRWAG